jgi:hypothetical protein
MLPRSQSLPLQGSFSILSSATLQSGSTNVPTPRTSDTLRTPLIPPSFCAGMLSSFLVSSPGPLLSPLHLCTIPLATPSHVVEIPTASQSVPSGSENQTPYTVEWALSLLEEGKLETREDPVTHLVTILCSQCGRWINSGIQNLTGNPLNGRQQFFTAYAAHSKSKKCQKSSSRARASQTLGSPLISPIMHTPRRLSSTPSIPTTSSSLGLYFGASSRSLSPISNDVTMEDACDRDVEFANTSSSGYARHIYECDYCKLNILVDPSDHSHGVLVLNWSGRLILAHLTTHFPGHALEIVMIRFPF